MMPESSKIIIRQLIKEDIRRDKNKGMRINTTGTVRFNLTNDQTINAGDPITLAATNNDLTVSGNTIIAGDLTVRGRITNAQ